MIDLIEGLGLDPLAESYLLRVSGPAIRVPWQAIFPTRYGIPPQFLVWPQRDLLALGSDQAVASLRLSTGELTFADAHRSFGDFVLAEDLDRLVIIGETTLIGLGEDGRWRWEADIGEIVLGCERDGSDLVLSDPQRRRFRVSIKDGTIAEQDIPRESG